MTRRKRLPNPHSPEEVRRAFGLLFNQLGEEYVPYTGANSNLDMGTFSILATNMTLDGYVDGVDYVQFDIDYEDGISEGRLQWNSDNGTLEVGMPGGTINMQIGQQIIERCRNVTGNDIPRGSPVRVGGVQGKRVLLSLVKNDEEASLATFGVAAELIANNSYGYVISYGILEGVDTTGLTLGYPIWIGDNYGEITTTRPESPKYQVTIGIVNYVGESDGIITVGVDRTPRLARLSDVYAPSVTDGQILRWVASNSRFEVGDHGDLAGLADDDHTQYILADGTRAFTGVVSGITPTADSHLTTKGYVDSQAADSVAAHEAAYNHDNYDTAYSWGDHAGLYDAIGSAAAAVTAHESAYNHANYDTAYSWGDHAGLYDAIGTAAAAVATHESVYNHANYDTAYSWGDHAGLYDPIGSASATVEFTATNTNAGAMVIGEAVYVNGNATVDKAKADASATMRVIALVADVSIAASAPGSFVTSGPLEATTTQWDAVTGDSGGLTPGAVYYLDASTAGRLTTTAPTTVGQFVSQVGIAISTTRLNISIQKTVGL